MASPIRSNLKEGAIAMIRGRMWNAVARICSYWASGRHITVRKPENPSPQSPITWDLDVRTAAPEIAHEFHAQDLWSVPDDNGEERAAPVSGYSPSGADSYESGGAAWTRGETAGGDDDQPRGVKITLPVRMQEMNTPAGYARIGWRTLEFDQNGCLVKVSEEAAASCFVVTAL